VPGLLDAELDPDDHRPSFEDHVDRPLDVGERYVGVRHPRLDRRSPEHGAHVGPADGVAGEELGGLAATLEDDRQDRGEQAGVLPGRSGRWRSAMSATSVRRGSITIMRRPGVFLILFTSSRAPWKPFDSQGLHPSTTSRSVCSTSSAVWQS
jgi:hypothetical protein